MKRKASDALIKNKDTTNNTNSNTNITNNNNDNNIDQIINDIKTGKNIEMMKRASALMRVKERTIAAADRHKKLQIKNISELYDYEIADAEGILYVHILIISLYITIIYYFSNAITIITIVTIITIITIITNVTTTITTTSIIII